MGYRSDWQLVIGGKPIQLHKFAEWMDERAASSKDDKDYLAYIWNHADEIHKDIENGTIVIEGFGWKCYSGIEDAIATIRLTATDDFGCETGYARIGEEYQDIECESDSNVWVNVTRCIEGPENTIEITKEDVEQYKDYLEGKKGRPVPPDKARWEDIANE